MRHLLALTVVLGGGVAAAQGVVPPSPLETPPAIYPRAETRTADVVTQVTVSPSGQVSSAEVVESAGAAFDEAALEAVKRWTFRPALRAGEPVSARVKVPFRFEPPPAPAVATPVAPPSVPDAGPAPSVAFPAAVPEQAPQDAGSAGQAVEEVSVRGTRRIDRGGSDFQIEIGQLASTVSGSASEILQLAPGIFIANEGGSGHADTVFLRGFNAEQGQDIEFTFNGIPINEVDNPDGHGYADTHFIIPELVKIAPGHRGSIRPASGRLRRGRKRGLRAGRRVARIHAGELVRQLQHVARVGRRRATR